MRGKNRNCARLFFWNCKQTLTRHFIFTQTSMKTIKVFTGRTMKYTIFMKYYNKTKVNILCSLNTKRKNCMVHHYFQALLTWWVLKDHDHFTHPPSLYGNFRKFFYFLFLTEYLSELYWWGVGIKISMHLYFTRTTCNKSINHSKKWKPLYFEVIFNIDEDFKMLYSSKILCKIEWSRPKIEDKNREIEGIFFSIYVEKYKRILL